MPGGAASLLALTLAGCGGGGSPAEAPPLSRAAFASAANRACATVGSRRERLERLQALRPSRDDRELVDRWLHAEETALDATGDLRRAIAERNLEDVTTQRLRILVGDGVAAGYARRLGALRCIRP